MKETVHFTKMHGAGNDYIYVDTHLYNIPDPEKAAIAWSAHLQCRWFRSDDVRQC